MLFEFEVVGVSILAALLNLTSGMVKLLMNALDVIKEPTITTEELLEVIAGSTVLETSQTICVCGRSIIDRIYKLYIVLQHMP